MEYSTTNGREQESYTVIWLERVDGTEEDLESGMKRGEIGDRHMQISRYIYTSLAMMPCKEATIQFMLCIGLKATHIANSWWWLWWTDLSQPAQEKPHAFWQRPGPNSLSIPRREPHGIDTDSCMVRLEKNKQLLLCWIRTPIRAIAFFSMSGVLHCQCTQRIWTSCQHVFSAI